MGAGSSHSLSLLSAYLLLTAMMSGCTGSQWHYDSGSTWGTVFNIKYLSDKNLSDTIMHQMQLIDSSLSPFQPNSLISRINSGDEVEADALFRDVFVLSQQVCSISGGMFDPTVAPLINLWGFGYHEGVADRPSQAQIDSALLCVGIRDCSIDEDGRVVKKCAETEFNFSAIAKGYGVDLVAAALRRNGCDNYMVEIGGEIALAGNGPSGEGWRIQIDAPVQEEGSVSHRRLDMLHLTDACIATSGNYRNHRATSEGEVGHTISPVTGMPVASATLSATVIAPSTALADALATCIMAMPDSAAMQMLSGLEGVEALIVKGRPDGGYDIITTPDFCRLLQ